MHISPYVLTYTTGMTFLKIEYNTFWLLIDECSGISFRNIVSFYLERDSGKSVMYVSLH
jgi:hypothetical protein